MLSSEMKEDGGGLCVYLKGAPERILTRCSKLLVNGEATPFLLAMPLFFRTAA
jgi:magnesium-transporting ATPase (P-type)